MIQSGKNVYFFLVLACGHWKMSMNGQIFRDLLRLNTFGMCALLIDISINCVIEWDKPKTSKNNKR